MPVTRDFKDTVRARAQSDPEFRWALLWEGLECLWNRELEAGQLVIRDYISATIGIEQLRSLTER